MQYCVVAVGLLFLRKYYVEEGANIAFTFSKKYTEMFRVKFKLFGRFIVLVYFFCSGHLYARDGITFIYNPKQRNIVLVPLEPRVLFSVIFPFLFLLWKDILIVVCLNEIFILKYIYFLSVLYKYNVIIKQIILVSL